MKHHDIRRILRQIIFMSMAFALCGCANDEEIYGYVPPRNVAQRAAEGEDTAPHPKQAEFEGVNPDGLKILAIGNSFTNNGTYYMPWLIKSLNQDEVFIAKLHQSGASLAMHWSNHVKDAPEYVMEYSHGGQWHKVPIATIDEALQVFDWDIVIFQQASALAGIESSYHPAFEYLCNLFRDTNSDPLIGWQYTWAYTPRAADWHAGFASYDFDPQKMHEDVVLMCDKISKDLDIRIPSAQLVKMLREEYPEREDGFSTDGVHLTPEGYYFLSCLWYEVIIKPSLQTSCLGMTTVPGGIDASLAPAAQDLVGRVLREFELQTSVPMIRI